MDVNNQLNGYGLRGLNERLLALKGVMEISSSNEGGCCIEIRLPMEADREVQALL